jgi:hypothetical protein
MTGLNVYVCEWGHVPFTDQELADAGVKATFHPRWTNYHPWSEPTTGMMSYKPELNFHILEDFFKQLAKDEYDAR